MGSVIVFVYTLADHTDVIDEFLEDLANITDNVVFRLLSRAKEGCTCHLLYLHFIFRFGVLLSAT